MDIVQPRARHVRVSIISASSLAGVCASLSPTVSCWDGRVCAQGRDQGLGESLQSCTQPRPYHSGNKGAARHRSAAYTALPTPTETVAAAGPSTIPDAKAQPQAPVTVTLSPAGLTIQTPSGSTSIPQGGVADASSSRPTIVANVSAPELHVPPTRETPVRANTTPFPAPTPAPAANTSTEAPNAPPVQKSRSRKPSIATPPRDLDKIDELDETDPLGLQWHNDGPYEAINKVVKGSLGKKSGDGAKIFVSLPPSSESSQYLSR